MKITSDAPAKPRGRPRSFDRDAALARAMELFWRQGYEATSISDLTAAMGINPPSLYATFGDKERLFLEAVERYSGGPGDTAAALAAPGTARDAIARMLETTAVELTRGGRPPGCMVVTAAMNCSTESAHLHAMLGERRAAAEARIRARIRRGIKDGDVPTGTNATTLAKFIMTVIEGMTIQARDGATGDQLRAVARTALAAWPG